MIFGSWVLFWLTAHSVWNVIYNSGEDKLTGKIDLIICLGGDGTLLYASTLFQVKLFLLSAADFFVDLCLGDDFICATLYIRWWCV